MDTAPVVSSGCVDGMLSISCAVAAFLGVVEPVICAQNAVGAFAGCLGPHWTERGSLSYDNAVNDAAPTVSAPQLHLSPKVDFCTGV